MRSEVRILSGAMFIKIFTTGPVETHSVLIGCTKTREAAIIDVPYESTPLLLEALKKNSLTPKMILLTHSHWDHLADAASLKRELGVPIFVHENDAGNLKNPGSDGIPLFFPIERVEPDGFLTEGETLTLGTLKIDVIHTPGHTPGGVCFWIPEEKLLISGDTLFRGAIGKLTLPTSNPSLMGESLKKLSKLPPETRVIPGHGPETTLAREKATLDFFRNSTVTKI